MGTFSKLSIAVACVTFMCACAVDGEYGNSTKRAKADTPAITPLGSEASTTPLNVPPGDFFPWPPPKPSEEKDITSLFRHGSGAVVTFGDVDTVLTSDFGQRRLGKFAYWTTPDGKGYVAVTRVDTIDAEGHVVNDVQPETNAASSGNLLIRAAAFEDALLHVPESRVRLFAIFITRDPIEIYHSDVSNPALLVGKWREEGFSTLPSALSHQVLQPDYKVLLRLYEIFKRGGTSRIATEKDHIPSLEDQLIDAKVDLK